jgi:hypothetical protein
VQQGDRHLVEQVGVVDGQQEPPVAHPRPQAGQGEVQQVVPLLGLIGVGQEVGEGAQRDAAGGLGGPHPLDGHAVAPEALDRFGDQAGLADPGFAEHHGALRAARDPHHPPELGELPITSHQRPRTDHDPGWYATSRIRSAY